MGISYTEEQKAVIEAEGCDLLVSAAAGSGKTAVLTERIVRMVSDKSRGIDIDRLLIVTFTNAAAAEMRERIGAALEQRLLADTENTHLQRQMTLLHNAQITTIDSFCLFVLRNNFNDIGLDPGFRIAEEGELRLLRGGVMEELIEARFEAGDEAFLNCLESLNQSGDERTLAEQIERLYDFSRSYPFPEKWLEEARDGYAPADGVSAQQTGWARFARDDMEKLLSACVQETERALRICQSADGPYMYAPVLEKEKERFEQCARLDTLAQYGEALAEIAFARLPSKRDESVSAQKREQVKGIRAQIKEALEKAKKRYFFESQETMIRDMQESGALAGTLAELTLEFGRRFAEKKREKNILDFADLEHFALRILLKETPEGRYEPSGAAAEYRAYFQEIMIDEYQDSNLVQEYILKSISKEAQGGGNRFMVGDVKQSIYRFRLARPELFMEKYETYTAQGERRKIVLHKNFRSRREVTESVNHVFSHIMGKELGGVDYDEEAALFPGAEYPAYAQAQTELLLLAQEEDAKASKIEQEAALLAERIGMLMGTHQVTDKETGRLRPVRYGDIAILLRTNAGWDEPLREGLKQYGIPAYTTSMTGYFSSEEIRIMLHFLRVLDNPLQDIPLFGVMRSPIGGFLDREIARLRAAQPGLSLYEALKAAGETACADAAPKEGKDSCGEAASKVGEASRDSAALKAGDALTDNKDDNKELEEKAARLLALIDRYRERTAYETVRTLLREIMAETGYLQYMTAFPEGDIRRANLEMLLQKAAEFQKTGDHSLFAFIRYMEQLEKYDVDYGEASALDEHADVVRIMSIHKSKGLEFPVCIVAGLGKRFNIQDQSRSVLMDADLGLGCEYADTERRFRRSTLRRNVLARKQQLDNLGEELRVLYVAMTRAKEKLILTGALREPEKKLSALGLTEEADGAVEEGTENEAPSVCTWRRQAEKPSFLTLAGAGSYLDFLLPVWETVRVVTPSALKGARIETAVKEELRRRELEAYERLEYEPKWEKEFQERFRYRYPWKLEALYTKTTVSELKMESMSEKDEGAAQLFEAGDEAYIPRFCAPQISGGGRVFGSAVHHILELLDFAALPEGADIDELTGFIKRSMEGFLAAERLTEEENACIVPERIAEFLLTEAAKRMRAAARRGKLRKEQPFMLGLAADRLRPEFPSDETVLIQGIIDVYWEEADGLVILDYKTDKVERAKELILRYQTQLDYYEEALARITGKRVKEKLIFSFHLRETISL